jgi:hypothetical protein
MFSLVWPVLARNGVITYRHQSENLSAFLVNSAVCVSELVQAKSSAVKCRFGRLSL